MPAANDIRVKRRFYRRKLFYLPVGAVALIVIAAVLAFSLSPRPGVLVIRYVFNIDTVKSKDALEKYDPGNVTAIADQQYRAGDSHAYLDAYFPDNVAEDVALPTLVWTHGGAWVSGDKQDVEPYFRLVASKGYAVVSLNYTLGPDGSYPDAVNQINDALAYLQANATRFHIDVNAFFMGGDSAGSQLTSQIATLTTNSAYAAQISITPALKPAQLRGVILACGIYDMHKLMEAKGIFGWGIRIGMWAYTGSKKDQGNPALEEMSTINFVTADFPPAYITGGNGDPLTDAQSKPLADKLTELGVKTETLFFAPDYKPSLGHEYQFNLDLAAGQQSLEQMLGFMSAHATS